MPNGGGAIQFDVRSTGHGLDVTLTAGSSIDSTARACTITALREAFQEEAAAAGGGPAVAPATFSALLTVSW